jgi:hypothetical protein
MRESRTVEETSYIIDKNKKNLKIREKHGLYLSSLAHTLGS